MSVTHLQLRSLFSSFWEKRGHKKLEPISLIPTDKTTLLTGSGMQQLVPYLLGKRHPLGTRLYNIQRCIRAQDIEEVGDNRHDSFFEMMGNWSLGDYFKKEQLSWYWEFLTKILGLSKEKLYVTVFRGEQGIPADEESIEVWKKLGIPDTKIFKYGADKNWWSRSGTPKQMPAGEPGGPDSEVFFDFGTPHDKKYGPVCHPNCECGKFLEIGNSVFMQYKKQNDGSFKELPKKNVDFGGGIERLVMAIENQPDMFMTHLYKSIVDQTASISNKSYEDKPNKPIMRIIADHMKAAVFLIKDGVLPSNKEQGYVLRRLLRRAAVKYRNLSGSFQTQDLSRIARSILPIYENVYFISEDEKNITNIIDEEMTRFGQTLDRGLKEIQKAKKIDGQLAFNLYQSFGFPMELTEELAQELGQNISKREFEEEFEKHKEISRTSAQKRFKDKL